MKKIYLFVVVTCALSSLSSKMAYSQDNVIVIPRTETIFEDSSAFNRMNKGYVATAQLYGSASGYPATGLGFGKYLDRNSVVLLEVQSGGDNTRFAWGGSRDWSSTYDTKINIVGLYLKNFSGNSFYYKFGIEAKRVSYGYNYNDSTILPSFERKFEGSAISGAIHIGNQWQWKSFTLGCDWVGIALPVSSSISSEVTDGSSYEQRRVKEEEERLVKGSAAQALRFYLGASF